MIIPNIVISIVLNIQKICKVAINYYIDFLILVAVKMKGNMMRRGETLSFCYGAKWKRSNKGEDPSHCSQNRKKRRWGGKPYPSQSKQKEMREGPPSCCSQNERKGNKKRVNFPLLVAVKMKEKAIRRGWTPSIVVQNERKGDKEKGNPSCCGPKWKETW